MSLLDNYLALLKRYEAEKDSLCKHNRPRLWPLIMP